MIRLATGALLVLLSIFILAPSASPQPGASLPGVSGGELRVDGLESADAVVVIWASWSPRCRDVDRTINEINSRWSGRSRVVSISFQEEAAPVRAFLAERRIDVPTYLDSAGSFSKRHGVTTLPSLLVLSRGRVAFRGRLPADYHRVIEDALARPR